MMLSGDKYNVTESYLSDVVYKVHMILTIHSVTQEDYGAYNCVSKNSLGTTDGTIKLYRKWTSFLPTMLNF